MSIVRRDFLKGVGSVALGSALLRFASGAEPPRRPRNILFLICDQTRFDAPGYTGNPVAVTPTLNRLARTGVNFSRTYCQNPVCTPARTSILLGRYCHSTGVWRNNDLSYRDQPSFPQVLRANGRKSAIFGKLHIDGRDDLDWETMDVRDYYDGPARDQTPKDREEYQRRNKINEDGRGGPGAKPSELPYEQEPEVHVAQETIRFMETNRDQPWFIQCSMYRPHTPWRPPRRFWDMIDPGKIEVPHYPDSALADLNPNFVETEGIRAAKLDDETVRNAMRGYYACLAFVDDLFGQVLSALDRLGQREDTLVIYTADHGEMLYDHFLWGKSCFFEPAVHVPLVMNWPGRLPAGKTSRALVEHIDIFPTLMDLTGIPTPATVQGRSLMPIMAGKADRHRNLIHSEDRTHMTMQFDGRYKFIVNPPPLKPELYDLHNDPREITNLAAKPEYQARVKAWTADVASWIASDAVPPRKRPARVG